MPRGELQLDAHPGESLPEELVASLRSGACLPLLGAGLSRPSGTPSWSEIVEALRARLAALDGQSIFAEDDLDLMQLPFMYQRHFQSRQPLHDLVKQALGPGYSPNKYHYALSELPVRTFLTTNWDTLLETALHQVPFSRVTTVYRDEDVPLWNEQEAIAVVKMHGTVDDLASIIFTEEDYQDRYSADSMILQLVKVLLATRSVVMLGFSFTDPFVKLMFRQVRNLVREARRPHWFVVPAAMVRPHYLDYMRYSGFTPIVVPSRAATDEYPLMPFLSQLAYETRYQARDLRTRAEMIYRETNALRGYNGPDRIIRIRAIIGPFGNPSPVPGQVMFGSLEQDALEYALNTLCVDLAEQRRFTIRMIGLPYASDFLLSKGYSRDQVCQRMKSFLDCLQRLGDRFEFAPLESPADRNEWIAADRSVVQSWKGSSGPSLLFPDALATTERPAVDMSIGWFDQDFAAAAARQGGIEACRWMAINKLQREISALRGG